MKITAVSVTTSNLKKTVEFYKILGFEFPDFSETEDHLEPITPAGSARLMIDSEKLVTELTGHKPTPSNHSSFAIEFDSPDEVNAVAEKVKSAGFKIINEPWDAFWGQRYAVVEDPDGYRVDLFAML